MNTTTTTEALAADAETYAMSRLAAVTVPLPPDAARRVASAYMREVRDQSTYDRVTDFDRLRRAGRRVADAYARHIIYTARLTASAAAAGKPMNVATASSDERVLSIGVWRGSGECPWALSGENRWGGPVRLSMYRTRAAAFKAWANQAAVDAAAARALDGAPSTTAGVAGQVHR